MSSRPVFSLRQQQICIIYVFLFPIFGQLKVELRLSEFTHRSVTALRANKLKTTKTKETNTQNTAPKLDFIVQVQVRSLARSRWTDRNICVSLWRVLHYNRVQIDTQMDGSMADTRIGTGLICVVCMKCAALDTGRGVFYLLICRFFSFLFICFIEYENGYVVLVVCILMRCTRFGHRHFQSQSQKKKHIHRRRFCDLWRIVGPKSMKKIGNKSAKYVGGKFYESTCVSQSIYSFRHLQIGMCGATRLDGETCAQRSGNIVSASHPADK